MIDPKSFPVDPYVLFYKLEMVILDKLLDKSDMADEFEYFSLIGQGGRRSSENNKSPDSIISTSTQRNDQQEYSQVRTMDTRGKEPLTRVRSHGKTAEEQKMDFEDIRPRTNSMPSSKNNMLRVRNFQTSSRGLENQGDTLEDTSHCSLASSNSSEGFAYSDADEANSQLTIPASNTHRILLLGGEGVGKTALTQQFLTSDDISSDDILDDGKEKFCTIKVDGEESFLIFMDSDFDKNNYDPSSATAYIVVYSCTDRDSFTEAQGLLKNLRHFEKSKAIILCGNKVDLVRKRQVSTEEGRDLAVEFDAQFIETSTILNHRVDHLLVGMLAQIKEMAVIERKSSKKSSSTKASDFRKSVKGLVGKIVNRGSHKSSKKQPPSP